MKLKRIKKWNDSLFAKKGLTLIELMVVVAIVGVLSSLAVTKYKVFIIKAKQAESKQNLEHIFTLQSSYLAENGRYFTKASGSYLTKGDGSNCNIPNALGFGIASCGRTHYSYWTVSGAPATAFVAYAKEIVGADGTTNRKVGLCTVYGGLYVQGAGADLLDIGWRDDILMVDQNKNFTRESANTAGYASDATLYLEPDPMDPSDVCR